MQRGEKTPCFAILYVYNQITLSSFVSVCSLDPFKNKEANHNYVLLITVNLKVL